MRKIRKDDEVIVIAGRDRGKRGDVMSVLPEGKLLVSGVNMVKKNVRANPQMNEPGGINDIEAPIDISNIAIFNPDSNKADRVGIREEDGKRVRYFKSTNELIDE